MRIGVFGMGYVGAVTSACFAEMGHEVIGVDVDASKVDAINAGQSPVVEEDLPELIAAMVQTGRLRATTDAGDAVSNSDIAIICVGTPSMPDGALDTTYVERVSNQIGAALKARDGFYLVVVRSTVLPGTVEGVVRPALAAESGKKAGEDIGLCFHPEFLREGSSLKDFREPPKIVIGATDDKAGDVLASLYEGFDAPLIRTSIRVAEMVKYTDNTWHALKVAFGNEIGVLCKSLGLDSHEVMDIFCQDRKLNISPAYLKPGYAYGGSCLPKDLKALTHAARSRHLDLPVLYNIQASNQNHVQRAVDAVLSMKGRNVGMVGLSFKRGTDDLRESPLVELAERLIGKGYKLKIYDENVLISRLRGGNRA